MIKQLSISDFFEDFNNIVTKPPQLLQLLDQYINIGCSAPRCQDIFSKILSYAAPPCNCNFLATTAC